MSVLIYHVATEHEWEQIQKDGLCYYSTRGRTLAQEGFIHCSYAEQVPGVLSRYYADVTEPLLLLAINEDLLAEPAVPENTSGGTELFPHLYQAFPATAVVMAIPVERTADGGFVLPE